MTPEKLKRVVALRPNVDDAGKFSAPAYILRNRRNRTAIGMTKTLYRSCQSTGEIACALSVKGTTDRLGSASWMYIRRNPATGKFQLTDGGKKKLARLKRIVKDRKFFLM